MSAKTPEQIADDVMEAAAGKPSGPSERFTTNASGLHALLTAAARAAQTPPDFDRAAILRGLLKRGFESEDIELIFETFGLAMLSTEAAL